jgi:hypothetical protein
MRLEIREGGDAAPSAGDLPLYCACVAELFDEGCGVRRVVPPQVSETIAVLRGRTMQTVPMSDGRLARLVPQDGPPTTPGLYLAEYTPRVQLLGRDSPPAERHTIAREVRIDGAGCLDHGPDSARLEWWAQVVLDAPAGSTAGVPSGGGLIRGATVDGEATDQRGEGAGEAEPSTPGREVVPDWWTAAERRRLIAALDDAQQERLEAESVACTLRARVAELEAAARWVPVGERLPDEGATVLVHSIPHGVMVATYQMDLVKPAFFGHGYAPGPVTHWRPMPAVPDVQP